MRVNQLQKQEHWLLYHYAERRFLAATRVAFQNESSEGALHRSRLSR